MFTGEDEREALVCYNRGARLISSFIVFIFSEHECESNCEVVIIRIGTGDLDG